MGSNPAGGASRRSSTGRAQKPLANPSSALNTSRPATGGRIVGSRAKPDARASGRSTTANHSDPTFVGAGNGPGIDCGRGVHRDA